MHTMRRSDSDKNTRLLLQHVHAGRRGSEICRLPCLLNLLRHRAESMCADIGGRTFQCMGAAAQGLRILLREAKKMQAGEEPFGPSHGAAYRNRAWSGLLPRNDNFLSDPAAQKMMETIVP